MSKAVASQISIQDVTYTYADGNDALKHISLDIRPNELFVLFGPARSGKSTLLRLLNRLSDLTEGAHRQGAIYIDG
ncbi:MAG: ATP-binding cassette domain-containing protein, partial [Caldilineaceae bacterium]|nr:ATP-binding cassette domain-containing protein [Caldilineaceae bacterium]